MQVFIISHFALWSEAAWRHKDSGQEKHSERVSSFSVSKNKFYDSLLVDPHLPQNFINFFLGHEFLPLFLVALFFSLVNCLIYSFNSRRRVSRFFPHACLLFGWCHDKYLIGPFFFDCLGQSIATRALILNKSIEEFDELSKHFDGIGSGVVDCFSVFLFRKFIVVFFNSLDFRYFPFAFVYLLVVFLFGFFVLFVELGFLQFFHFPVFGCGIRFPKNGGFIDETVFN